MVDPKHIEQLEGHLMKILQSELADGNKVVETAAGWPTLETIIVFLEKPFQNSYDTENNEVDYFEVNDPHYWKAEYRNKNNNQVLACRF